MYLLVSCPTQLGRSTLSTLPTRGRRPREDAPVVRRLIAACNPHQRAANAGNDSTTRSSPFPRRWPHQDPLPTNASPPRRPATDQDRALEGRAGNRHELLHHALLVGLRGAGRCFKQARTTGQEESIQV